MICEGCDCVISDTAPAQILGGSGWFLRGDENRACHHRCVNRQRTQTNIERQDEHVSHAPVHNTNCVYMFASEEKRVNCFLAEQKLLRVFSSSNTC